MLKKAITIFCAIIATLNLHYLHAQPNVFLEETDEIEVLVENLSPVLENAGLARYEFQTSTELFLRQNEIKVVDKSSGYIYVQIAGVPLRVGGRNLGYAYSVNTSFHKPVKSLISEEIAIARVWSAPGTVGIDDTPILRSTIKDAINDQLSGFVNEYLKANQ